MRACCIAHTVARCDQLIGQYEREHAAGALPGSSRFDYVTWLRLDVVWELAPMPALPLRLASGYADAVWLPQMNSQQGGLCDKFAFGTRRAMSAYLNRLDLVDRTLAPPAPTLLAVDSKQPRR